MTWAAQARKSASLAVKVTAAGLDVVRPATDGVVVLLYHRVGGGTSAAVDLPVELFEEQIAEIAHRAMTIDGALDVLGDPHGASDAGGRDVVVTFDDGTEDFVDNALPILVRHNVPAVVYVATDFVESGRSFPRKVRPLSWPALGDAVASGLVTVGSHTHSHALFDRVDAATAAQELDRSIDLIGDRLSLPVAHFAYPKALAPNAAAEAEVRRRFRSAAVAGTTRNRFGRTDPYRLARSPIQVTDGMVWFRRKAAGGMAVEDRLRRLLNRRYAGAVT